MNINKNLKSVKKNGVFDHEDDYVMYILINKDTLDDQLELNQLVSRCCSSVIKVVRQNEQKYNTACEYLAWRNGDENKIFLRASQEELLYAINNYSDYNRSIWSQHTIDLDDDDSPFILTTVTFTPMIRKDTPEFILSLEKL